MSCELVVMRTICSCTSFKSARGVMSDHDSSYERGADALRALTWKVIS